MTLPDAVAALVIGSLAAGAGAPALGAALRRWRLDAAARHLAMEIHRTRMQAVARAGYAGLRFDAAGTGRWRLHGDGGSNGMRTAEIVSGEDPPLRPPVELAGLYPGVSFGFPSGGVPRIPPSAGTLGPGDDPLALGGSSILSASPTGETTSGSVYLTDGKALRALVVYGPTGRVRLWSWEQATGWRMR
ncbi:MAG TPA: hypothetical protein VJV23_06025 [Candidatus Polarisedimenticolia bacterium]|nr:hypothetical protein [Candidatus Polarisedimenticolia bacterium]